LCFRQYFGYKTENRCQGTKKGGIMQKKWLCILLITMGMRMHGEQKAPNESDNTIINLIVENKQEANSSVIFPPPPKKMRCAECKSGAALKDCLQATTNKKRKKLLQKLSKQHRSTFIKNLNRTEYEEFLSLFTEQEWHDLLVHLSESEQQRWPQSIKEQFNKLLLIKENGDADYYINAIKDAIFDLVFLPLPLAYGIMVSFDCHKNARNALEKEEQEYKKYIEEKFS
jgi:hypothetical protein